MVQVDESAVTTGSYTDEELVLAAKKARLQSEDNVNAEEEEEEIKMEEIISALKVVRKYSQKNYLLIQSQNWIAAWGALKGTELKI